MKKEKEDLTSSKNYYLLTIEELNFDYLFRELNGKKKESHIIVAKSILDEVICRTAWNYNLSIENHTNLKFNSKILLGKYGNIYPEVLKKLTPFILFRTGYEVNKHSRAYFLNDVNLKRKVDITSFSKSNTKGRGVVNKIKQRRAYKSNDLNFLYKFFNPQKLKVDVKSIYENVSEDLVFSTEKAKNILRLKNALDLNNGLYIFIHDEDKTKRLYSSFTMLKKEDRKKVTYDNKKLVELDIKNSIPTIFSLLLTNSLKLNYKNIFIKNSIYNNYILMFLKSAESLDNIEVLEFQEFCVKGKIYEYLRSDFQKKLYRKYYDDDVYLMEEDEFNLDTRKLTKLDFISMLFADNDSFVDMQMEFEDKFPSIANFLFTLKEEIPYEFLSHILFAIESEIMINIIARGFNKISRGKVPLFTIHDCICTTEENVDKLLNYAREKLEEVSGHKIMIEIE